MLMTGNQYRGFTVADTICGEKHHLIDPQFQEKDWWCCAALCGALPQFSIRCFDVDNICSTCLKVVGGPSS